MSLTTIQFAKRIADNAVTHAQLQQVAFSDLDLSVEGLLGTITPEMARRMLGHLHVAKLNVELVQALISARAAQLVTHLQGEDIEGASEGLWGAVIADATGYAEYLTEIDSE